ncbi:ATP-binding cassette domain-containing protein [Microlunatus sp. Gsoil 973]|uniref:ATP-binding cassette domain-containing protein n=1 Tax=Microlunatus sp. Gsoil 973 TaxID=2672569 RepID=UPI0012B45C1F|nr:ATP-binding cassette domain-containing protein [Microlunatus sp. Gsoil 973]QGN34237.1 ATP-binding cassette domain-containing protein [Microlunatus sp. Gsoil 973]
MTDYAIETVGLTKAYRDNLVLSGLDLRVGTGQVFALLGPNGAGKTTLINILSTLLRPDAGTARVAGYDVVTQAAQVRSSISLTGQYAAVDEVLTGRENLIMMCRLTGLNRHRARRRAKELLDRFDLGEVADRPAGRYSGGLRRRLDLAIGLITIPPVIFLDEPTTGLDTRSRQALWELIASLPNVGATVFLTTQDLAEADHLADRIVVIDNGAVVAEGTPTQLKSRVGTDVVELRDKDGRLVTEIGTDGTAAGLRRVLESLRREQRDLRVVVRSPSLDDVFLSLTEQQKETAA